MKYALAAIIVLLSGVLAVQVMILRAIPRPLPTMGELRAIHTFEGRREALLRQPLVRVSGSVDADVTSMP